MQLSRCQKLILEVRLNYFLVRVVAETLQFLSLVKVLKDIQTRLMVYNRRVSQRPDTSPAIQSPKMRLNMQQNLNYNNQWQNLRK